MKANNEDIKRILSQIEGIRTGRLVRKSDIFEKLDNVIGNYSEGKASCIDVCRMANEVNDYLKHNPHPHELYHPEKENMTTTKFMQLLFFLLAGHYLFMFIVFHVTGWYNTSCLNLFSAVAVYSIVIGVGNLIHIISKLFGRLGKNQFNDKF